MFNKKSFVLVILFFVNLLVQAQYNYSSNTAHLSLSKAIEVSNNIIKERTSGFEKKAESKPLMFVNVKKKISALNIASNSLSSYIEKLQKEVNSERVLHEMIEDEFYENLLFIDDELSPKGKELKQKLDYMYYITKQVNIHGLTHLSDFANEHFNTKEEYYNAQEKQINYFEHFFFDRSNYAIMMTLNYLLLDVKTFQLLYYRTVMSYK